MKNQATIDRIADCGLVGIVRLDDLSSSVQICRALLDGGLRAMEFTFTNSKAAEAIAEVKKSVPEFKDGTATVGAGTILTVEQAERAAEFGAEFIVSPTLCPEVLSFCVKNQLPMMPGAFSPTEILQAWDSGASVVKVFPAGALGAGFIKDILGPLPSLRLMPTGGVDLNNAADYFSAGAFAIGVGGNLVDKKMIAEKNWTALTARAKQYSDAIKRARGK